MLAEQAIFTSMTRRGKSGYHLVSRSPGVTEGEAGALAAWAPSHGGLLHDDVNRVSVNFHPLPGGRFALSRSCEGRAEYSGRGARQIYTHAIVVSVAALKQSGFRPFALYRDALALGYFHYQANPDPILKSVELSSTYADPDENAWSECARAIGRPLFESLVGQIDAGQHLVLPYEGDRAALVEAILDRLPPESVVKTSFATSLLPSSVHPYRVSLVSPGALAARH